MKKILTIITSAGTLFFLSALRVSSGLKDAVDQTKTTAGSAGFETSAKLIPIIGTLVNAILSFVGVIFIALIIKAGITWMTAGGKDDKVTQAQTTIFNSAIGLIVTLSAWAIYRFVGDYFGL